MLSKCINFAPEIKHNDILNKATTQNKVRHDKVDDV